VLTSISKHFGEDNYRLELRRKHRASRPKLDASSNRGTANSSKSAVVTESAREQLEASQQQKTVVGTQLDSLQKQNADLLSDISSLKLNLQKKQDLELQLEDLQRESSSLAEKYQGSQDALRRKTHSLQEKLDEALMEQRKLEEQVLVLREVSTGREVSGLEEASSKSVLEQIQHKYSEEVNSLTGELRVKDKSLTEMRNKKIALVRFLMGPDVMGHMVCVCAYVCVCWCVCWRVCVVCVVTCVCMLVCVLVHVCVCLNVCWYMCVYVGVCVCVLAKERLPVCRHVYQFAKTKNHFA